MTEPLIITEKRKWQDDKYAYISCRCNGVLIGMRSSLDYPERIVSRAMESSVKNTLKIMKCFGATTQEGIQKYKVYTTLENAKKLEECEIPEFDSLPFGE